MPVTRSGASSSTETSDCSVSYFRNMLKVETKRLSKLCDGWEDKLVKNQENIPDSVQGELRSVVGQGRLVMAERFKQFAGLVDNCEFSQGEKETTCMDLKGFWEMIYFQVLDVDKKFGKMEKIEANNWMEVVVEQPVAKRSHSQGGIKRRPVKTKSEASAGLKALIAAKRRKAEVSEVDRRMEEFGGRDELTSNLNVASISIDKCSEEVCIISPEKTFHGGFFSIKSPSRHVVLSPSSKSSLSTGADKLRKSVLTESAKRMSGLVSPFVSQVARRAMGDKSPVLDSRRSSLFDEFEEESDYPCPAEEEVFI